MAVADLDKLPGFRRRMRVEPGQGSVRAAVEDDYHSMHVVLHHDGEAVTAVDGMMERWPWTTCPGAAAQLRDTFIGISLSEVAWRGEKQINCTHLHDLAQLAAAHARDAAPITYDILVSDPIEGRRTAEIRRNETHVLDLTLIDGNVVEPTVLEGVSIFKLRSWIESLEPDRSEAARLLQWAAIIAHGRQIPMENQSDASRYPPTCYSFQPHRVANAVRIGEVIDFSAGSRQPLEQFCEEMSASRGGGLGAIESLDI